MLTAEQNERLTRVGPGTPTGELLRRYWHPIAATVEMAQHATEAVRTSSCSRKFSATIVGNGHR